MRAILVREFGGPEVLKIGTVEERAPGPLEVKVRVRAAGVNPFETYMINFPPAFWNRAIASCTFGTTTPRCSIP